MHSIGTMARTTTMRHRNDHHDGDDDDYDANYAYSVCNFSLL